MSTPTTIPPPRQTSTSNQFGLPPCTAANGCFVKVNQFGRHNYPSIDAQWAFEISIDTQMVSALCASCRIVLVETKSNGFNQLFTGIDQAYAQGANAISLSWGTNEFSSTGTFRSETNYDPHFQQRTPAGHTTAVTAGSGDSGHLWYPAASPYVTAVGGTSATRTRSPAPGTRSPGPTQALAAARMNRSQRGPGPGWDGPTGLGSPRGTGGF
jgi:subtilase family serine protease